MLDDISLMRRPVSAPLDMLARTDDVAFIKGNDRWTFARLADAVDRLAAGMVAFGIAPGDRVALHLNNGPEIAIAYLACFRVGAVAAPLNTRFKQAELTDALGRLQPRAYLGQSELYGSVRARANPLGCRG